MIPDNEDREIKTMSVPYAGRLYYGLGRNGSYEAAKRGEIPVIKVGARLRVPVIAMERKLADAGQGNANDVHDHNAAGATLSK
jgi:hypothetical protein